jgi:hypothetical protein
MIHGDFREYVSGVLDLFDQLEADRPADALQLDLFQNLARDQAKIAIHISNMKIKEKADKIMIGPSNDATDQRIVTRKFIAIDHLHPLTENADEFRQFERIVLRVSVGIKDPIFSGRRKPRP